MAGTLPTAAESDVLNNLITNLLDAAYIRLLGTSITLNSATTLATCTAAEATFTGYAAVHMTTWSAVTIDGTNAAVTTCTQGIFTPTGVGGSGNIYGYYLSDSGQTKFYGAELFTGGPASVPQSVSYEVDVTFSIITRF